ncbi:MAG: hypothetical protein BWY42_01504 [Candidatus Omnitrophica bacterium ADurb.Bin277]|nr:MAG: hypothetical protein BWY42_01504 [Candidatus Omnitrophica bacterium ADurb.Bin277]
MSEKLLVGRISEPFIRHRLLQFHQFAENFSRVNALRLFNHGGVGRACCRDNKPQQRDQFRGTRLLQKRSVRSGSEQINGPAKIREQVQLLHIKLFLDLQPCLELFGKPSVCKTLNLFPEGLEVTRDSILLFRGKTVLVDVGLVKFERVGTDQFKIRNRKPGAGDPVFRTGKQRFGICFCLQ